MSAETAHRLKPDDANILDTLGVAQMRYGKAELAVETLKKAGSRNPGAADMRVNDALALVKTGERDAAREELRQLVASGKAVTLDPNLRALLDQR